MVAIAEWETFDNHNCVRKFKLKTCIQLEFLKTFDALATFKQCVQSHNFLFYWRFINSLKHKNNQK